MCESKVYLIKGNEKEKIMDEAVLIKEENGKLIIFGLLGEKTEINGRIVRIDMYKHEVHIEVEK